MKRLLRVMLFGCLLVSQGIAAPSSIDSLALPKAPSQRFGMKEHVESDPDLERWYYAYRYFEQGGAEIKHGLEIERKRSRDRERFDTDYVEKRRIYYEGKAAQHFVESTWVNGVLRKRVYHIQQGLEVVLEYNADGALKQGPKAHARGGRAKRERIVAIFHEVYELE